MESNHIIFLDIETVPAAARYDDLSEQMQLLWEKKAKTMSEFVNFSDNSARELYNRAAIYAEFGKIVCISVGRFSGEKFVLHSFADKEERLLLDDFATRLASQLDDPSWAICGHNAKEFDIPFIARRMLINGMQLPRSLNISGKKPWEIPHIDTMELWKFGDYKHFTSLELLDVQIGGKDITVQGIPTQDLNAQQKKAQAVLDLYDEVSAIAPIDNADLFIAAANAMNAGISAKESIAALQQQKEHLTQAVTAVIMGSQGAIPDEASAIAYIQANAASDPTFAAIAAVLTLVFTLIGAGSFLLDMIYWFLA